MSKKPVPSKKQARSSTRSRWGTYVRKQRTKLSNKLNIITCPQCGAPTRAHFACADCGYYNGNQVYVPRKMKALKAFAEIEA